MRLHDDTPQPECRQPLAPKFKGSRTRAAARDAGTREPRFSGLPAETCFSLSRALLEKQMPLAPPVANPAEARRKFIRHVKIPQTGYGASRTCCKHWRSRQTRRLDPVQWTPKNRCADKAQGKAWRQPFYLALPGPLY
jgi:hypothetical protein